MIFFSIKQCQNRELQVMFVSFSQQHELTTYRPCIIAIIYISPEYSDTWGTNVSSCEELATDKQSTERGHGFYH